jgi:hypothetical protein
MDDIEAIAVDAIVELEGELLGSSTGADSAAEEKLPTVTAEEDEVSNHFPAWEFNV